MGILRDPMQPNPYAAPRAPSKLPNSRAPLPRNVVGYRSTRTLGKVTIALCGVLLMGNWLVLSALILSLGRIDNFAMWGRVGSIPGLLAMVAFFVWLYRAAANVRRLGQPISWSPGMCVLWFFVPLANLVMPARIVGQIEIVSQNEAPRTSMPAAYGWWCAYVVCMIEGYWVGALMRHAVAVPALVYLLRVVGTVALTTSLVMLLTVTERIADGQDALCAAAKRGSSS